MAVIEKKHRLSRQIYTGRVAVAFTLCLQGRYHLFTSAAVVDTFVALLKEMVAKHPVLIPVYCFMPDHQHLIMRGLEDTSDILKTLGSYKQKIGFWLAKNRPEIKWQKDFFDHIIRNDEKLSSHINYILGNPVRRGLVVDWRQYP
jgi:putative transposase